MCARSCANGVIMLRIKVRMCAHVWKTHTSGGCWGGERWRGRNRTGANDRVASPGSARMTRRDPSAAAASTHTPTTAIPNILTSPLPTHRSVFHPHAHTHTYTYTVTRRIAEKRTHAHVDALGCVEKKKKILRVTQILTHAFSYAFVNSYLYPRRRRPFPEPVRQ